MRREKTAGAVVGRRAVGEWYLLRVAFELLGAGAALLRPPAADTLMVAGDEDVGHFPSPVGGRAGVVRVLRHPLELPAERLLGGRVLVAEGARQLSHQN